MAKKQRQPNLPQETLERARREMAQHGELLTSVPAQPQVSGEVAPVALPKYSAPATRTVDLHSQYAYVLTDLKNMATLAAFLLIVLVAFSFVI